MIYFVNVCMIKGDCAVDILTMHHQHFLKSMDDPRPELLDVHVESRSIAVDVWPLAIGVEELEGL